MKRFRPTRKRAVIAGLVILLVGGGILLAVQTLQAPAEGTIIKPMQPLNDGATTKSRTATVTGENFALDYDSAFSDVSNVTSQDKNALEQYRLSKAEKAGSTVIAINVKKLPVGGLNEDASYRLRKTKPADYTESNITVGSEAVALMKRTDGSEITAFMPHKRLMATIAITSSEPGTDLDQLVKRTLDDYRWRD